jgi:hypothetical protein
VSDFGRDKPRDMPGHLFHRSLRIHYETAVRANPENQNCSICPRFWYIDATFRCDRCGAEFLFSAAEQRVWYEDYGFWIDSLPTHCRDCRRDARALKALRLEYDQTVAEVLQHGNLENKKRLALVIDHLYEFGGDLPSRINEARRRLANQIAGSDARDTV